MSGGTFDYKQGAIQDIAGYYVMDTSGYKVKFAIGKKPLWFHRLMMRVCFGWYWEDSK